MQKQKLFNLSSMPKMVLIITLVVMLGTLFGAVSYLLKMPTTNLSFVNPVVETQCEIDSDCKLAYTGSNICLPCNTSIEEYKCFPLEEAKKIEEERFKRMVDDNIFCERCLEKSQHTCKCENGKCEKVKEELVEEVSITTDKTEYEQGEEVELAIKNNFKKSVFCETDCNTGLQPFVILQRYEKNKWIKHRWEPYPYPPFDKCDIPGSFCVEIKNIEKINLFLKSGSLELQLPTGNYRIGLTFGKSCDSKREYSYNDLLIDKFVVYSNEFTIKEKSALDARCGEKVEKDEICNASFGIGYEFNLETRKCIERGVSGCSSESPFETLEECQEVCEENSDTSNWQTYRNEEFGFEVKYPKSWLNASNVGYGEVCITAPYRYIYNDAHENGCVRINILQNPRHFDAKTFYEFYCQEKNLEIRKKEVGEGQYCFSNPEYRHIQIGDVDAINFYSYLAMSEEITIWIPYNNIIVQLNLLGYCAYEEKNNREKEKILMEIVNTFKFIEN